MYDEMAAVGLLVAFVEIYEGGEGQGSSGSGVAGEVVGEVFEVIAYAELACFDGCEAG